MNIYFPVEREKKFSERERNKLTRGKQSIEELFWVSKDESRTDPSVCYRAKSPRMEGTCFQSPLCSGKQAHVYIV